MSNSDERRMQRQFANLGTAIKPAPRNSDLRLPRSAQDWVNRKIGDIGKVVGGGTPSTKKSDNFGGDIPWLTPRDLSGQHDRRIQRGARNLSKEGLASCSARLLPADTLLLSTRAPIGYVAVAAHSIATNQGFRSIIVKPDYDHDFLYYWLKANTQELERHAAGSTFKELSGSALKEICVRLPRNKIEQRSIADILGTLDDKIELNRRMNETLEAMARSLFKSWFVNFEPVRAKMDGRETRLPQDIANLFPGRFVDSEMGEIPEGWTVGSLGAIATLLRRGVDPGRVASDTPYIGLQHMPRQSIALTEWGEAGSVHSGKFAFEVGDILFGKLRPYFHKVGIAPVDGLCSTDIVVLNERRPNWFAFVLACVSESSFVAHASQVSTGTKMPRTSWQAMSRYELCRPTDVVARAFQDIASPMLGRIIKKIHESRTLATLRDILLPKLISGEIRVPVAERALESVT